MAIVAITLSQKLGGRRPERLGDIEQPNGAQPVGADLVFAQLLGGDANRAGQAGLGDPEQDPALADALADFTVDVGGQAVFLRHSGGSHPRQAHLRCAQSGAGVKLGLIRATTP